MTSGQSQHLLAIVVVVSYHLQIRGMSGVVTCSHSEVSVLVSR